MAKKKDKVPWLWILLGGGALWYFMKQQGQAAPAAATAAPATTTPLPSVVTQPAQLPLSQTVPPVTTVIPPVGVNAGLPATPVLPLSSVATSSPSPASATTLQPSGVVYQPWMDTLQSWAVSALNACDLNRWNSSKGSFTNDEWNGLYDLYFNDWVGGQGNTAARISFWNTWRAKYSIDTNTPC